MTPDPSQAETERIVKKCLHDLSDRMTELEDQAPTVEIRYVYESRLFHWLLVAAGYALGVLTMILWGLG